MEETDHRRPSHTLRGAPGGAVDTVVRSPKSEEKNAGVVAMFLLRRLGTTKSAVTAKT